MSLAEFESVVCKSILETDMSAKVASIDRCTHQISSADVERPLGIWDWYFLSLHITTYNFQ